MSSKQFSQEQKLTIVKSAAEIGIKAITLFAFSTENWNRPKLEIDALMSLLISSLKKELNTFQESNFHCVLLQRELLTKHKEKLSRNLLLQWEIESKHILTILL